MEKYDVLVVGSGLYGSMYAYRAKKQGKRVKVLERRSHIGGNIYTEKVHGIHVHKYGAHIFHTSDKEVWEFVNNIVPFKSFINSPIAVYEDDVYSLPFNMYTFNKVFGVTTPAEAKARIEVETAKYSSLIPRNLEEQALKLVGETIYSKLIKGYTEKQWGRSARDIPSFIIRRLPLRFTWNNNYFRDTYQGIPEGGYTALIKKLLEGIPVEQNVDYLKDREFWDSQAKNVLFTGPIDEFYNYQYGNLDYRSLRFEHLVLNEENHQGNAVVNYTKREIPYTRILEHKHFLNDISDVTVISKEYSYEFGRGDEPYYPINDDSNNELYNKYRELADLEEKVFFGGRLAEYKYYDMNVIVRKVLDLDLV